MKSTFLKSGLLALALISIVTSCSKKEQGYTITGKFTDVKEGMVYLEFVDGDKKVTDSTTLTNGNFSFNGKVEQPLLYTLKLKGSDFGARFLLDNEVISFEGKKDSVAASKFSGAIQDSIYKSYDKIFKKISAQAGPIYKISDSLTENGKVKLSAEQKAIIDKRWADLETTSENLTEKFIKEHKDKVAAVLVINERVVTLGTPEKVKQYYSLLSPEVQKSFYGQKLKSEIDINDKTAIGVIAPEFSQNDVNGKVVKLSDYRGKYVLVDFWASWCHPCRDENPNVVAAYKAYHDKGFEILGVSLDSKKDLWEKAIEKDALTWSHVSDLKGWKNAVALIYGVKMVPTNYLIGPDGKIIAKNLREEGLQTKLKEIFVKS